VGSSEPLPPTAAAAAAAAAVAQHCAVMLNEISITQEVRSKLKINLSARNN